MNWDAIGAVGEIIGAAAVVISLLYVAVQIRQNTQATKNLAAQNLTEKESDLNAMIAANDDLALILQKGFYERDKLSEHEQLRFNAFWVAAYTQFDFAYRQYVAGQIEEASWKNIQATLPTFLGIPGVAAWWEQDKVRFSAEFVEYVDNQLETREPLDVLPTIGRSQKNAS